MCPLSGQRSGDKSIKEIATLEMNSRTALHYKFSYSLTVQVFSLHDLIKFTSSKCSAVLFKFENLNNIYLSRQRQYMCDIPWELEMLQFSFHLSNGIKQTGLAINAYS